MANNIKGITIEIGGDTTKLGKALSGVNKTSRTLNTELREIQKSLKFNPGNTELLEQQQRKLGEQIENTSEKLDILKEAARQAEDQLASGDMGQDEFDALTREIIKTENQLESYTKQLADSQREAEKFERASKDLQTLFEATGKSVDDFADVLGKDLVKAIKEGKADSDQLEEAIEKIGKSSLGSEADIDKLRKTLAQVDDGADVDKVAADLKQLEKEANDSEDAVKDLKDELVGLASTAGIDEAIDGLAEGLENAADKLGGVVEQALEQGTRNAKIEVTMDLDPASTAAVKDSLVTVQAYGIDAEEALNGVRKQFQLNADASDEVNQKLVEGAGAVASAYDGVDFEELIQETNEISSALNISDEEALGLVNSLLKVGFPAGELDIIAEYGLQLQMAGYSAEEVQAIMAAGVETGSWNIDNLLDGLKEGRVRLSEFGLEVPKATQELLANTDISVQQMQDWGTAVAQGGEAGKQAMQDVAQALVGVQDETVKNELGVQIFGTMWEDQGTKITDTLLGMDGQLATTNENEQNLLKTTEGMQDANYNWNEALLKLQESLAPLLEIIAGVVSVLAEWISACPGLAAVIMAVIGVGTILVPILTSLGVLFASLQVGAGLLGVSMGALVAPVLAVIAVIAAIIAIGVLLVKNWDNIKAAAGKLASTVSTKFNDIKTAISDKINAAKDAVGNAIEKIKSFLNFKWSLPKLKMPHISISGKFSINPPSAPKFNINWYKEGAIFASPSVIGVGEAGAEAVLPIERIDDIIASALEKAGGGGGTMKHTGTIRVEGVNNQNELAAVVDIILDQLRREARS